MSNKYISSGEKLDITATGAVTHSTIWSSATGDLHGVYLETGVTGDVVPVALSGEFTLPKEDGSTLNFVVGQLAYVKSGEVTPTATGTQIGYASTAAATGDTTATIILSPA